MAYKCRLKLILAEMEIKHGEFAEQIGIDKSSFSSIVNNKSLPSFETLYTIVEELTKRNPDLKLGDIWRKE
ncbi:helix-turn-helix domain-containing protein [Mesobacillus sp. S13]|uniref:helix-turn-helix domain-containing protein n=1 Tax=Mesobacillus sp. S13 TaxID=2880221 RepID=UPI001CF31BDD|nr:helix-turn-helix transcriptional regulator [Mesobacillus sp. S13]